MNICQLTALSICATSYASGASVSLITSGPSGSETAYFTPSDASVDGTWTQPAFDDSGWNPAIFGAEFGSLTGGDFETTLPRSLNASIYFRSTFSLPDASSVTQLRLSAIVDDGIVVYLNGVEIGRDNVTGPVQWDSTATSQGNEEDPRVFNLDPFIGQLIDGENLIAFHIVNSFVSSSDAGVIPTLTATVVPEPSSLCYALLALVPILKRNRK